MYIHEERALVLKMLQDGTINVDQAEKLLIALSHNCFDYDSYFCECRQNDFERKIKKLSRCVDDLARDLGDGAKNIYKKMEPKLKKAAQCVAKKASVITRELSDRLSQASDKLDTKVYNYDYDSEE